MDATSLRQIIDAIARLIVAEDFPLAYEAVLDLADDMHKQGFSTGEFSATMENIELTVQALGDNDTPMQLGRWVNYMTKRRLETHHKRVITNLTSVSA